MGIVIVGCNNGRMDEWKTHNEEAIWTIIRTGQIYYQIKKCP